MGANHDIFHFGSQPEGRTPTSPYQTARVPPPSRNHQTRVACPILLFAGAVGALSASKKHRFHHTTLGRLPPRAKTTVLTGARFTSPSNTARQPNHAREVRRALPYYQNNHHEHELQHALGGYCRGPGLHPVGARFPSSSQRPPQHNNIGISYTGPAATPPLSRFPALPLPPTPQGGRGT